jgi:rare lipoprotein A (peptidoglycan hydrolase)
VSRLVVVPLAIVSSLGPLAPDGASAPLRASTASWYGPGLFGNPLGCGGTLWAWTRGVAHKTLECGTRLRVCATRCRTTRVIDRGPYVPGREFDLTQTFAAAVGLRVGPHGWGRVYVRTIKAPRSGGPTNRKAP